VENKSVCPSVFPFVSLSTYLPVSLLTQNQRLKRQIFNNVGSLQKTVGQTLSFINISTVKGVFTIGKKPKAIPVQTYSGTTFSDG